MRDIAKLKAREKKALIAYKNAKRIFDKIELSRNRADIKRSTALNAYWDAVAAVEYAINKEA